MWPFNKKSAQIKKQEADRKAGYSQREYRTSEPSSSRSSDDSMSLLNPLNFASPLNPIYHTDSSPSHSHDHGSSSYDSSSHSHDSGTNSYDSGSSSFDSGSSTNSVE